MHIILPQFLNNIFEKLVYKLAQKNFDAKKILAQKKFVVNKFWGKKIFLAETIIFGVKQLFWGKQYFGVKNILA